MTDEQFEDICREEFDVGPLSDVIEDANVPDFEDDPDFDEDEDTGEFYGSDLVF